jgi:hypothetical protein
VTTESGGQPYPTTRLYLAAIARTLKRVDDGQPEEGDEAALDEFEAYFDRIEEQAHEVRVKEALFAVTREAMERQGGERLQPDLHVVRDE